MKINVIESEKNKLVFELEGLGHTFSNILKDELRFDEDVVVSTYTINHPLTGKPKFFLKTNKNDPKKSIKNALKRLKVKNAEFLKAFNS